MPIVYGKMYPEFDSAGLLNKQLKLFFYFTNFEKELPREVYDVCTLKVYFESLRNSLITIQIYTNNKTNLDELERLGIKYIDVNNDVEVVERIRDIVLKFDIDVITTNDQTIIETFKNKALVPD